MDDLLLLRQEAIPSGALRFVPALAGVLGIIAPGVKLESKLVAWRVSATELVFGLSLFFKIIF